MSREYATIKIKEALQKAKGNTTKARQHLIAWAMEDARLLKALSAPYLTGITAHAINRVVHTNETEQEVIPQATQPLDMTPESFGKEILGALTGNNVKFGDESYGPAVGRKKASQSHIDAIYRMTKDGKSSKS